MDNTQLHQSPTQLVPSQLLPIIKQCAVEVFEHLGALHSECTYQNAMEIELQLRGVGFSRQPLLPIFYKHHSVGFHQPDLMIQNVIVELKTDKRESKKGVSDLWICQLQRYLDNYSSTPKSQYKEFQQQKTGLLIVFFRDQVECVEINNVDEIHEIHPLDEINEPHSLIENHEIHYEPHSTKTDLHIYQFLNPL